MRSMLSELKGLSQSGSDLPDTNTAVLKLVDTGLCYREIAERVGITRGAVAGILHRERVSRMSPEEYGMARQIRLATRGNSSRPVPASKQLLDDTTSPETPAPARVLVTVSVELVSEPIAFVSIGSGRCRWPLWSPDDQLSRKTLCGASCGRGTYCTGHTALAYRPAKDRRAA